jgi:hypothetical protein
MDAKEYDASFRVVHVVVAVVGCRREPKPKPKPKTMMRVLHTTSTYYNITITVILVRRDGDVMAAGKSGMGYIGGCWLLYLADVMTRTDGTEWQTKILLLFVRCTTLYCLYSCC